MLRVLRLICLVCLMAVLCSAWGSAGDKDKDKSKKKKRKYTIAQAVPFPPWDVGPLEGVTPDVMRAICEANAPMTCRFEVLPATDCFDSDVEGAPFVGPALASGWVDGCVSWFRTPAREQLGAEFGHAYSSGSVPQLIASDGNDAFDALGEDGSLDFALVGFFSGFFNDATCLGNHYTDFSSASFSAEEEGRAEMIDALLGGEIDLAFWDSQSTVPEGTHLVGVPIMDCGPNELGLAVYPPSKKGKHDSDALRRDYNCGLALIRANGVLEEICTNSPHPGGDPACILEGPLPTQQCLADNPE